MLNRSKPETERRKWSRLPLAIPVFVHATSENGGQFLQLSSVVNISAGGALVAIPHSLPASSEVVLEIPSAPPVAAASSGANSRTMRAGIVRIDRADGYHLIAVKFAAPLPTDTPFRNAKRRKAYASV